MADVAIPLLFLKPFVGVDAPTSPQEVTFTRFVVTSYLFCNQPHVDMIMEFIALTKQKFKLAADSVLHFYSLTQLLILMMEDIENNAAKHVLIKCLEAQSQFPGKRDQHLCRSRMLHHIDCIDKSYIIASFEMKLMLQYTVFN